MEPPRQVAPRTAMTESLPPPALLIVDDSEDSSDVLSMALEQQGFTTATASNGAEALRYLERQPAPVCMLIDYDMPDMDGLDLALAVRQHHGDDIVLIAITGSVDVHRQRVQQLFETVDHHFYKPVEWDRLMGILAALKD